MSVRKREWTTSRGERKEAWIVDYADAQGDRHIATFERKKAAETFQATVKVDVGSCGGLPPVARNRGGPWPSSLLKTPRQNESSLIQFFYHESVEARMRGAFTDQGQLFSYLSPEARVRADHPLRKIRELVRDVLGELNRSLSRLYACEGRPS